MDHKICVIFTGGTIGSKVNQDNIDLNIHSAYTLLKLSKYNYMTFDILQPLYILSENIITTDWLTIKDAIDKALEENYTGIIITHGTDTLPYTAAAISYMFRHTQIPIVFVSSQYPLDDSLSNGVENFDCAVSFILNAKLPGIFVAWCEDRVKYIHLATRIIEATPFDCKFSSIAGTFFGYVEKDKFYINSSQNNPSNNDLYKVKEKLTDFTGFSNDILLIKPYPGIDYDLFTTNGKKPKAILHSLYHSGTACADSRGNINSNAAEFFIKCTKEGIDCYIAPIPSTSEDLYSSSNILLNSKAICLPRMSLEAALVKLQLAYGSFRNPKDILDTNIFYEKF